MLDGPEDEREDQLASPTGAALREYIPHPYQQFRGGASGRKERRASVVRPRLTEPSTSEPVRVSEVGWGRLQTPEVTVETDAGPDSVVVRIADNGPGIAADSRAEIFESGEKGVASSGTGTGLYLVHSLVEEYGGDIWVEDRSDHLS